MKGLKTTYQTALLWRDKTGQGVLDNQEDGTSMFITGEGPKLLLMPMKTDADFWKKWKMVQKIIL
jgi:hypothetical protein